MEKSKPEKIVAAVSIDMRDHAARIEKLSRAGKVGGAGICISAWMKGGRSPPCNDSTNDVCQQKEREYN